MRQNRSGSASGRIDRAVSPLAVEEVQDLGPFVDFLRREALAEAYKSAHSPNHPELVRGVGDDGERQRVREPVERPATVELMHDHLSTSRGEAGVCSRQENTREGKVAKHQDIF